MFLLKNKEAIEDEILAESKKSETEAEELLV
jgi:hypothetical protein